MPDVFLDKAGNGMATLMLTAPGRRNALTAEMADKNVAACDAIDGDESICALVVQAEGPTFCVGAHQAALAQVAKGPATDEAYLTLDRICLSFLRITRLLPPTVAAVRGAAVGAGLNLVLSTGLRIVTDDAKFVFGFIPLGAHRGGVRDRTVRQQPCRRGGCRDRVGLAVGPRGGCRGARVPASHEGSRGTRARATDRTVLATGGQPERDGAGRCSAGRAVRAHVVLAAGLAGQSCAPGAARTASATFAAL